MCGIAGFFVPFNGRPLDIQSAAIRMVRQLAHRGPDGEGIWCDSQSGLSLAHRRLSILDLSAAGHQPMLSHCGRYVITFNGEIYNHQSIRQELRDTNAAIGGFNSNSDTETMLAAISCWGLEKTLAKSVGMYAFALWDREERVLHLVRDRIGEKPLYYGLHKGALLFASELKAIMAYPGFHGEVDRNVLAEYFRYSSIQAPFSIFKGIFKLPPGSTLRITQDSILKGSLGTPKTYWSFLDAIVSGKENPFEGSISEVGDELERLLKQSVSGQMLADVPVGAFLSGGVDSSTVVALMQSQTSRRVKTFTIGFHQSDYDEAHYARAVATHLGTDHTALYLTPDQALAVIPNLPKLYDEPFADVSQIPTFLVSELAKSHVGVCLSGDGGDELFGGYNRHLIGARLWRSLILLPKPARKIISAMLTTASPLILESILNNFSFALPKSLRISSQAFRLKKIAELLTASSPEELYFQLISHWSVPERLVIGANSSTRLPSELLSTAQMTEIENQMMLMDSSTYLPDDVLVKIDRAAMGVSLETRTPILDHRIVEFAWRLPLHMKIRKHEGKLPLRQVLDRYVPRSLTERPKAGFGVPIDLWLRGPLKDWAEDLLDPVQLKNSGYLDTELIWDIWKKHLSGKQDYSTQLWSVLMFQEWINAYES